MKKLLRKYAPFLIILGVSGVIKFSALLLLQRTFSPNIVDGQEYDLLDYTRLYFVSLRHTLIFIDISLILALGVFLIFKSKLEKDLVVNIQIAITGLSLLLLVTVFIPTILYFVLQ